MPQPVLRTPRLILMPLADEHRELTDRLDTDPEVMRFIEAKPPTAAELAEAHERRMRAAERVDGLGFWVALDHAGDLAGLMMLPPAGEPGEAELGYRLAPDRWRQGLATEAARELLRHGFDTVGLHRIFAQTMAVNAGSRGVMRAIGMHHVRTFHLDFADPLPGTEEGEVEYAITRTAH